jgi:hypothetical protein
MHSKSFTVDNQVSIVAPEHRRRHFRPMRILRSPIRRHGHRTGRGGGLGAFDQYRNSEHAYPVGTLMALAPAALEKLRGTWPTRCASRRRRSRRGPEELALAESLRAKAVRSARDGEGHSRFS